MHMAYKLGSLFDGSGGFPLAGSLCGIEPVWASEVEPYPIAVTRSRFPNMRHLGDISKVNGGKIEPVDIITFGSPCQDLSVAGKRAGLKHEANGDEETTRSGLFMEAVRIIKEMRKATNGEYPTFALWENVPGAFSSNRGEDFRTVCEELIKIVEPSAVMPPVPKNGWPYADSYCGDGWSLSYRTFDAQYWGVPQRRRRIHLVLDLRGERAREVLFEREGVRGYFAEGRTPWQAVAGDAADRSGADDCEGEGNCLTPWDVQSRRIFSVDGPWPALYGGEGGGHGYACIPYTLKIRSGCDEGGKGAGADDCEGEGNCLTPWDYQGKRVYSADGVFPTLYSAENSGQQQQAVCLLVMDTPENCKYQTEGYCKKIRGGSLPFLPYCVPYTLKIRSGCEGGGKGALIQEDKSATLATNNDQYLYGCNPKWGDPCHPLAAQGHPPTVICKCYESHPMDSRIKELEDDISPTFSVKWHKGAADTPLVCIKKAYSIENHPADSRVDIDDSGKVQTLTSRMGTGGGNVPMVLEKIPICMAHGQANAEILEDKALCLNCNHEQPIVLEAHPVYCLQGSMIGREDKNGPQGDGVNEETSFTLNTIDRHAVAFQTYQKVSGPLMANSHPGSYSGQDAYTDMLVVGEEKEQVYRQGGFADYVDGEVGTLRAAGVDYGGGTENLLVERPGVRYIVRRLTPTECARLQGFPDDWGHPDHKEDFTDEEYRFWLNVRNTHAAINDKPQKDYTKAQMLTWYNKLHTDSAEYKMWGNGIALPPALYCLQGIVDALGREEERHEAL